MAVSSDPPNADPSNADPLDPDTERRAVIRQSVSVGFAAALYGVSLGALGVASGLSIWQTCFTSLILFTGGSQFALVGVLGGGGSAGAAISASSLLAVRNMLYALQLAPTIQPRGLKRIAAAQLTIDETTAVSVAQSTPAMRRLGFWTTGIVIFIVWNTTTLIGALVGNELGDPRRYGLDAAASGAFLALLWPRLRSREPIAVAVVGAATATVLVPVVPAGLPIVAAAAVAVVVGLMRHRAAPTPPVEAEQT